MRRIVANEMKGPNGTVPPIRIRLELRPIATTGMARKNARNSATMTFGPMKAPIIAPNLISPPPCFWHFRKDLVQPVVIGAKRFSDNAY